MRPRKKQVVLSPVSKAVTALREALGQTQQQFANTLGTAITTIARYETGREPKGSFLARLAEIASQNNQAEIADVFRAALLKELGTWDTTGVNLSVPKDDAERLYVTAVLAVLRNPQYFKLIPRLNRILDTAAATSIEKLDWIKRNQVARETAMRMSKEGKTPEQISEVVGVSAKEVRSFLEWARLRQHIQEYKEKLKQAKNAQSAPSDAAPADE